MSSTLRPKVVYIMGSGRSGTTLLGSILGELPGVFNAGEVAYIWERGILEPRGCGCGADPIDCPVWSRVIRMTAGSGDPRALAEEMMSRRRNLRLRNTWGLLGHSDPGAGNDRSKVSAATDYARVLAELYRHLFEVTGAHTIVDTSKYPADAALIGRLGDIEPFFVHLVRDPRAVANSWRRRKEGIARRKLPLAAADWLITNLAGDAVRRRHRARSVLIPYEALIQKPAAWIRAITTQAGLPDSDVPLFADGMIELHANHTVSGNPDRFRIGPTRLTADEGWHAELPGWQAAVVVALTWPRLRHYGYPWMAAAAAAIEHAESQAASPTIVR